MLTQCLPLKFIMLISLFNSYYLIFRAHVRHLVIFIVHNRCWYFVISDVVISASALKTIFNNFMPQLDQTWTVPFVVRRHGDKSVIYFDKTLPPTSMTTEEKTRFRIKRGARIKLAPPWDKIKKSKLNQMKKNEPYKSETNIDILFFWCCYCFVSIIKYKLKLKAKKQ